MMSPGRPPVYALILLSLISLVGGQTPADCQGSGQYCAGNALYECVAGEPRFVEECSYECQGGECVDEPLAPNIQYQITEPEEPQDSDLLPYLAVGVVAFLIVVLFARMALRK